MGVVGKRKWCFAAGHIPLVSTGVEPTFTSHDKVAVLNAASRDAMVKLTIFYEDENPVTDHELIIRACSVRKIRLNDIIDPFPIPLDKPYSFLLESDIPVVVQFSRAITARAECSGFVVTPYHKRDE
jgi:hypothetical protein